MESKTSFQYLQLIASRQRVVREGSVSSEGNKFLCVGVKNQKLYINTEYIGEIIMDVAPSPVGHSAVWLEGLVKVQGEIYSAVNIGTFLNDSKTNTGSYTVALSPQYNNIALIIDTLLGLHSIDTSGDVSKNKFIDVYQAGKEEINVLSVNRLLASPEFKDISIF